MAGGDCAPHAQLVGCKVEIVPVKAECFPEAQSGAGERPEQWEVCWRRPLCGRQERADLLLGERLDLSLLVTPTGFDQPKWRG